MVSPKFLLTIFSLLPLILLQASSVQLSSGTNPSEYGTAVILTATVSPNTATGKVTFYDGTTVLGTSTITSGLASLHTTLPSPGSIAVRAYYTGDANNQASVSASLTQVVTANPDGGFAFPPTVFGSFAAPQSFVVADFNGDGKADLAVGNFSGLSILLGNGQGTFQQAAQLSDGFVPVSIATGDFNGDGNIDLAVTNQNSVVSVFLGNGNGTFQTPSNFSVASSTLVNIAVADFNGDGNADLVVVDSENDHANILLGNGSGGFQPAVAYAVGATPSFVVVGDFNGDGKPDLAVANSLSDNVSILLGNGDGTFQMPVNYATGVNPSSIVVNDFNRDGNPDLAVANRGGGVSVLIGNGNGTFQTATTLNVGSEPMSLVTLDFNGDGLADIAVANYESDDVAVLLGNGNGTFKAPINVQGGSNPNFIAVGDFNSDGRPDLAVSEYSGEGVGIILATPQTATNCTFAVTVSSPQTLPASGGTITASVQTGSSCGWVVAGLPPWITATPSSTGTGSTTVALVVAPNTGGTRSAEIDFANNPGLITQLSTTLSVNTGGVVSAASYSGTVAPGSVASIFGNFLLAAPVSAASAPVPTNLSGLSVEFGESFAAPVFYASLLQVNIQVPWELTPGQTTLTSSYNGQTSVTQAVNVAAYAPGLFSMDDGVGQGAILNSLYQLVSSTNPAAAGSYVQIYCTGLGPVTNQPATGAAAPASGPLSETTTIPVVTIGGVAATVLYSGLAPGTVGEYQINAQVPAGAPKGNEVPVVISIGGVTSNPVTMAVE